MAARFPGSGLAGEGEQKAVDDGRVHDGANVLRLTLTLGQVVQLAIAVCAFRNQVSVEPLSEAFASYRERNSHFGSRGTLPRIGREEGTYKKSSFSILAQSFSLASSRAGNTLTRTDMLRALARGSRDSLTESLATRRCLGRCPALSNIRRTVSCWTGTPGAGPDSPSPVTQPLVRSTAS